MGDPKTATRRLNFTQSFNPLGSNTSMFVASQLTLTSLEFAKCDAAGNLVWNTLSVVEKTAVRTNDLEIVRNPYLVIGMVVLVVMLIIGLYKMPAVKVEQGERIPTGEAFKRLIANAKYREGVIG